MKGIFIIQLLYLKVNEARIGWFHRNGLGFNRVGLQKGIMHLVSKEIVHMRTKGIEVLITNIEEDLWQLARTMYKMAFMLAVIPKKAIWWNQI